MLLRNYVCNLARKLIGVPYLWGGQGVQTLPGVAFDCSGFVIWILQVFELLPQRGDWTADQLSKLFAETFSPEPGDLICYGKGVVRHIGIFIGDAQAISAAGGGPGVTSVAIARKKGARVKIHPIAYRKDFAGYRSITQPLWGKELTGT